MTKSRLFISYARNDDKTFVKRLYDDLIQARFDVWWDMASMPSRALKFLQEIRDAIDGADRVLLVLGPAAIKSGYVKAEWKYALETCKVIIPILRMGDYSILPSMLNGYHCPDFRESRSYDEAISELFRILNDPLHSPGSLWNVPALPSQFLPRIEELNSLSNHVLADIKRPTVVSSTKRTTVLQGMGGIGKSVVAASFARDCQTRRAFQDGIFWITIGQNQTEADLYVKMRAIGATVDDELTKYVDFNSAKARLNRLFENRNCLIILDDVWDSLPARIFNDILGTRCRLLITTRHTGIASQLGANELPIVLFTEEQSNTLLEKWAGYGDPDFSKIANQLGHLPLALKLAGARLREGTSVTDWLAKFDRVSRLKTSRSSSDRDNNLQACFDLSINTALSTENEKLLFFTLGVFSEGLWIPEQVVIRLWRQIRPELDAFECEEIIADLSRLALIERNTTFHTITLHDLLHDYNCEQLGTRIASVHEELLDSYRVRYPLGWHTLEDDGYIFRYLFVHLLAAKHNEEAQALSFDFEWLKVRLTKTDIFSLLTDFDLLLSNNARGEQDEDLYLIREALKLSAHVVNRDPEQLAGQLFGRLLNESSTKIEAFLRDIEQKTPAFWLRPIGRGLTTPGGPQKLILTGHHGNINAALFSPDRRFIVSASDDKSIRIWDSLTGAEHLYLKEHRSWVRDIDISPDSKYVVSVSRDKTLKIWEMEQGNELKTLGISNSSVVSVMFVSNSKYIASITADGTINLWDFNNGQLVRSLNAQVAQVNSAAITSDGKRVVLALENTKLMILDIESGEPILELSGHSGPVMSVAVALGSQLAVSGSTDQTLIVWNLDSGILLDRLVGHQGWVRGVSISRDGRLAFSASWDNSIGVWDIEKRQRIHTLTGHSDRVNSVSVSTDNRYIVTGSADQTVRVWDLARAAFQSSKSHRDAITSVAFTPDGRYVFSAARDNLIKMWDALTGKEIRTLEGHNGWVNSIAVSGDGQLLASGSWDCTVRIWTILTGAETQCFTGHEDRVNSVLFTQDCKKVISASSDHTIRIWNLTETDDKETLPGYKLSQHRDYVNSLVLTQGDKFLVSASHDKTLKVWDFLSRTEITTLAGHQDYVTVVLAFNDGRRFVSGSLDYTACIWDVNDNSHKVLTEHTDHITGLALSSNEQFLVSSSQDSTLCIWDTSSGDLVAKAIGHKGPIVSIKIPILGYAVSASLDRTIRVWELPSGKCVSAFTCESPLSTLAISPNGHKIVAGDQNGQMYFWRIKTD